MTRNRGLMRYYTRKEAARRAAAAAGAPDYVIEHTQPVEHLHMRSRDHGRCWSCSEPWPCSTYKRLSKPA